ncbi:hypothetical protein B0H14DRAFT_2591601 [Mycena olivaceomarginata]|nr:hypothetical protein B0H14DRAFT_2591601 [Mycena olivaceomarginata]
MDSDATLTPQAVRLSSPTSVVEIARDEFPPLTTPAPAKETKPRAKATKVNKGKGRAKAATPTTLSLRRTSPPPLRPPLAIRRHSTTATEGASMSRRPTAEPSSPSKRRRSNTAGDTSPAPIPTSAATPANAAQAPGPTANPVASVGIAPAAVPVATPVVATPATAPAAASVAAPTAAPAAASVAALAAAPAAASSPYPPLPLQTAPVAAHVTAPVFTIPAATYAAALVATPAAAPAAAPVATPAAVPVTVPAAAPVAAPPTAAPVAAPVAAPAVAPALPPPLADGRQPPPACFPSIMYSPEQLLQGVPADLVQMYKDVGFPKFFLVVSGGNGAVMRTHGLIHEAIANYINIDPTTFTLGTPPTAANGSSPTLWLAADIPDPLAQGLVDARILSSTNITLYTLPYNMPIIGFVGVFAGFTLPNTVMGANAVRDLIGTAVQGNSEISQFVQTHRDAFGPQVSSGEAWGTFLASITVHGIVLIVNDTNTVAWRLHVTPPYQQSGVLEPAPPPLRQAAGPSSAASALPSTTPLHYARSPDLPGWLGPTPATIAALEDASRAAASKAQEQMRLNTADGAGSSNTRSGAGRGQGSFDGKARRGGKAKRGGDFKGKGKLP